MRKYRDKNRKYGDVEPFRGELGEKEALRRLWSYLRVLRVPLLLGIGCTLLWSVFNLGQAGLVAAFIHVIGEAAKKPDPDLRTLNQFTALAFGYFAVRGLVGFGMQYCWQYLAQAQSMRLRNEVFAHLQRLPVSFFDHRKTGQLMSTISNDIPAVNNVLSAIQDALNAPLVLLAGIGIMFYLNVPLALLSCVCLPPIAVAIGRATQRIRRYTSILQRSLSEITEHAEETISGIRVVKSFGNEDYETRRFFRHSLQVFRSMMRTIRVRLALAPIVEYLGVVAIILVLWVGGKQIIQSASAFRLEQLAAFAMILKEVANAARNIGNISVNLTSAGVAADRVFTLLDIRPDIQDKPDAIDLAKVVPALSAGDGSTRPRRRGARVVFEQVGFAYSPGIPVLAGISFAMEPGEVVALVGSTGAGKTTIAALIPRFYDVTTGRVTVDGIDVRDLQLASLRAQIGIVPQETVLFAGTLRENIAYGRLDANEEEIVTAARMANAWEFIERFPDGLDTLIGERGTRLSGGQRQRIAIARAVLRDPRILILDEATSSLDTQSEALVQDALQRLVTDRTTVVIAHRLSTIRNADRILVIQDGQIAESGRHEQLLRAGGLYAKLYHTQFRHEEKRALETYE